MKYLLSLLLLGVSVTTYGAGIPYILNKGGSGTNITIWAGTFYGDGAGLTNINGGSATNLTPWTSDINAAGKQLTNVQSMTSTGTVTAASFSTTSNLIMLVHGTAQTPKPNVEQAAADAVAGDTILLSAGTFYVTNWIKVPTNGGLIGAGPWVTLIVEINTNANLEASTNRPYAIINPSDGCTISGLGITNPLAMNLVDSAATYKSNYSGCIGMHRTATLTNQTGYSGCYFRDLNLWGRSDALYVRDSSGTGVEAIRGNTWENVLISSPWDTIAYFNITNVQEKFIACTITNWAGVNDGGSVDNLVLGDSAIADLEFVRCSFSATQQNANAAGPYLVNHVGGTGGSFKFQYCTFTNDPAFTSPSIRLGAADQTSLVFDHCSVNPQMIGNEDDGATYLDYPALITDRLILGGDYITTNGTVTYGTAEPSSVEANGSLFLRSNGQLYIRTNGAWATVSGGTSFSMSQVDMSLVSTGALGFAHGGTGITNMANTNELGGLLYLNSSNTWTITQTNLGTGKILHAPSSAGGVPSGPPYWAALNITYAWGGIDATKDATDAPTDVIIDYSDNFAGGEIMAMGTDPLVPLPTIVSQVALEASFLHHVVTNLDTGLNLGGTFAGTITGALSGTFDGTLVSSNMIYSNAIGGWVTWTDPDYKLVTSNSLTGAYSWADTNMNRYSYNPSGRYSYYTNGDLELSSNLLVHGTLCVTGLVTSRALEPFSDDEYTLGAAAKRYKHIYVAEDARLGTIYGNGSGVTNIQSSALPDPMELGEIQVGTIVLTNALDATNVVYSTNLSTMAPDFNKAYSTITTNAAFAFLAPLNVSATLAQTAVLWVTNSTAAAVAVTAPANVHAQGTWYVTNVTVFTFFNYGSVITNAIAFPLW